MTAITDRFNKEMETYTGWCMSPDPAAMISGLTELKEAVDCYSLELECRILRAENHPKAPEMDAPKNESPADAKVLPLQKK